MLNKVKNNFMYLIVPALIVLFCLNTINTNAISTKNVLFISSYSPSFITFDDQLNGICDSVDSNYEVQIEYMDIKKFNDEEFKKNFYNLIKFKTKNYRKYDGIILGDDAALDFALNNLDLFKNTAVVFLGISDEDNIKRAMESNINGGVIEKPSISENLNLIHNLFNENKNLILISGDESKYKKEIDEFYNFKSKYKNFNYKNIVIPDKIDESFLSRLSNIDKNKDVVLYLHPYIINSPKDLYIYESIKTISKYIDAPIFTTLNYNINDNMVGGKVVSHYEQSTIASKLLKSILDDKINKKQLITSEDANVWYFNYDNLVKYNIQKNKLPKNSIIINKPIPFFEKHKELIFPVTFTLIGLVCIIIALLIHTHKTLKHKEELNKSKKIAEDANIAKSNFIANISHELRTPVTVISSANQLLSILLSKETLHNDDKILSNLNIISQNSNRLIRLINNVIDVAKFDCGFYNLKLKNIDIISFIENTALSVIPYAKSKKLNIIFDTNVEELNMCVDPEKIERIVLNLLSNAIKFSSEGEDIFATIIADKNNFNFIVQDNGVGIDEANLNKIFEKFTQIDSVFTRQNEGSGIGLSIVKSFVKLHQGTINVNSKLGEGSSFIITLPINSTLTTGDDLEIPSNLNSASIELSDIFK
ncbi:sensor histidine kinase [Romboutsia sp. 1001713B170131_170501_G6]|uniref:sensor histidine kinase n=1 Tax=Romboutsia sp. 1001713B170131_170501_G6 TaxID=2787108 RepID=UPI0018ABB2A9|nr:HAMP domain-containing sensor histidine kinase [Romboutsia sp. 1001713B170131_170501_G6]